MTEQLTLKLKPRKPGKCLNPVKSCSSLAETLQLFERTPFIINRTKQPWGIIRMVKEDQYLVTVETVNGITDFGFYEMRAWIEERIISPLCPICQEPIHGGAITSHLQTHQVKVYG